LLFEQKIRSDRLYLAISQRIWWRFWQINNSI